jgi:hypothetical protein
MGSIEDGARVEAREGAGERWVMLCDRAVAVPASAKRAKLAVSDRSSSEAPVLAGNGLTNLHVLWRNGLCPNFPLHPPK